MSRTLSCILALVLLPSLSLAGDELSLDDLLDLKVSVASKSALSTRESPGIVSVLTKDEIRASGARDLQELLQLVPGFQVGVDVQGARGLGVRGNWAHEGKWLILVDGHELNERLFSTFELGQHLGADQIERIEIIRGPGSSIYGGYAELAVVNVVTVAGGNSTGGEVTVLGGGLTDGALGRAEVSGNVATGGENWRLAAHARLGAGTMSGADYTDIYGNVVDLGDATSRRVVQAGVDLRWKQLHVNALIDQYGYDEIDLYDEVRPAPVAMQFHTYGVNAVWSQPVGDTLTITPRASWKLQVPWRQSPALRKPTAKGEGYAVQSQALGAGIDANWEPNDVFNVVAGGEALLDTARALSDNSSLEHFGDGDRTASYTNAAWFAQGMAKTKVAIFTAGARMDMNSGFGVAFVPRAAISKAWDGLHIKLLASRAFRAPGIENYNWGIGDKMVPEFTTVLEAEVGAKLTEGVYLTANVYDVNIKDAIVYFYAYDEATDSETEGYKNYGITGTRGAEAALSVKRGTLSADVSYAMYIARPDNQVDLYAVPDKPGQYLGFANHRVIARGHGEILEGLIVSPSAVWQSPRAAATSLTPDEQSSVITQTPSTLELGLYVGLDHVIQPGVHLGVGISDILNSNPAAIQPYDSWHAPMPKEGREVYARARWAF